MLKYKKKMVKLNYECPKISLIIVEQGNLMDAASGNAGTIGSGGVVGDAKQSYGWEDEDISSENNGDYLNED